MKKIKKYFSLVLVLLLLIIPASSAFSAEVTRTRFAVLGDSIASGYGLENAHDCYASLISSEKSYHLSNDAVPGHTTLDLLNVICNSENAKGSISEADLISVSIGGNDLIQLLSKSKDDTSAMLDIMLNGVNAKVVKNAVETIKFNLNGVCTELRLLNPDAPIIFQTIYNPLYANDQYSSYAPFAESFVPVMMDILKGLCNNYENIFIADVHTAFDAYYKETESYDIIHSDGIHPSQKGHALIANVITDKINELENAGLVNPPALYYYLLGDADGNGRISISDATIIQKIVVGLLTYRGDIATLCLDATEDSSVNIKDATAIQKHLADLPANPNIGTYLAFYEP